MQQPFNVGDELSVPLAAMSGVGEQREAARLSVSLGLVFVYWWAATGLMLASQQSELTRMISLLATVLLAVLGVWIVFRSRDDATPAGARHAFLGAALIWWWGAALFYGGFGLRIPAQTAGAPGSATLALEAIASTLRSDLVMVAALLVLGVAVWTHKNRVALFTLAVLWGTLQTAKLNVFFGVRNSGADLLPPHLARLRVFFGPSSNSALLLPTVLVLTVLCVSLISRARNARTPFTRHAMSMLALLLGLALVEHLALGVPSRLPLWDVFMPAVA